MVIAGGPEARLADPHARGIPGIPYRGASPRMSQTLYPRRASLASLLAASSSPLLALPTPMAPGFTLSLTAPRRPATVTAISLSFSLYLYLSPSIDANISRTRAL